MRKTVFAALLLVACGGDPSSGPESADGSDATSGGESCAPGETSLGGTCWSAAGTHWRVQADGPGGVYRFEIDLLAAGRLRSTDHGAAAPATDEWFQDGPLFRFFLADRFVEYRTTVTNGTVIVGEAINVRGQRWSWRGDRVFEESVCVASEIRLSDGCMSVAGTSWEMDGHVIQFLQDGVVAVGEGSSSGSWDQVGGALRFTVASAEDAGEVPDGPWRRHSLGMHLAELESSGEISGTYESGEGSWSAARIVTIPPVMHE